jgi:hypothetical protein
MTQAQGHGYQRQPDQQGDAVRDDQPYVPGGDAVGNPEQESGQEDREIAEGHPAGGTFAQHAADLQDRREAHQHAPGRGGDGEYGHGHGRSFGEAPWAGADRARQCSGEGRKRDHYSLYVA